MLQDLLKVQKTIEAIEKDGTNPFFKSGYATLNATIESCKKILNDNNFICLQPLQSDVDGVYVCTTLIHTSGDKIESRMRIESKADNDPQAQGSAITYARRYSLQSLLLMSAVDDDGEKATNHTEPINTTNKVCPKCKGKLIAGVTKTGKKFLKCEKGGWDSQKQVATGCNYVDWLNPVVNYNKKEPYAGKTMTVEEFEGLRPEEEVTL